MEHNDIRHRLSEYIDGSIAAKEKAAIETHLQTCQQCRDALHEIRKTIEHIKTVEEIEPPAWMTQKIMATVREEAGRKQTLLQRLFYPLAVKLPIQAVAVLFLTVTAFYIYQNMQPAERASEAPVREFAAKKQAPPADTAQDKLAKAARPAIRSKQIPQTPAYKSLDMKQEYEAPHLPVPAEKAAEPAAPSGLGGQPAPARNKAALEESPAAPQAATPQAAAPVMPQKKTGRSVESAMHADGKRESAAPQRELLQGVSADDGTSSVINITVSVTNIETATRDTEATIKEFNGTINETQRLGAKRIYVLSLDTSHANDLVEKLKRMGTMKEKDLVLESRESRMVFRIELKPEPKAAVGC